MKNFIVFPLLTKFALSIRLASLAAVFGPGRTSSSQPASGRYCYSRTCTAFTRLLVICFLFTSGIVLNPRPALTATQPLLAILDLSQLHIISTPGDGHCLLHALRLSVMSYLHVNLSESLITSSLHNEILTHFDIYMPFVSDSREVFLAKQNK